MEEVKTDLAKRLKGANNVLVTVSRNPSLDQLAALLGLGLFLNKEGKHCAAVFSGEIPSALEFLKPETTIQKNTDSLRDFIIALDKSKADKLRYKVEDNIVRIFITPYKSSIGKDDLEFSQGDFNVDVVVALGVADQADLDEAITAHGRILHDATVASINVQPNVQLGSINWSVADASSLSELVTELVRSINAEAIDEQISTALLTGIVATTDRFSNDKTSAKTMTASAQLMAAGANQQLVANKLEESEITESVESKVDKPSKQEYEPETPKEDGALEIDHDSDEPVAPPEETDAQTIQPPEENIELPAPEEQAPEIEPVIAEPSLPEPDTTPPAGLSGGPRIVTEPPTLGGTLTANSTVQYDDTEPTSDPLSMPQAEPPQLLDHVSSPPSNQSSPNPPFTPPLLDSQPPLAPLSPPPSDWMSAPPAQNVPAEPATQDPPPPPTPLAPTDPADLQQVHIDEDGTLSQLEQAVDSPHVDTTAVTDAAREEVNKALSASDNLDTPAPIEALNAQPLGPELHDPNPVTDNTPQPNLGGVPGFDAGQVPPPPVPPPFNPGTPV